MTQQQVSKPLTQAKEVLAKAAQAAQAAQAVWAAEAAWVKIVKTTEGTGVTP